MDTHSCIQAIEDTNGGGGVSTYLYGWSCTYFSDNGRDFWPGSELYFRPSHIHRPKEQNLI